MRLSNFYLLRSTAVLLMFTHSALVTPGHAGTSTVAQVGTRPENASSLPLRIGTPAPEFEVSTLDGKPVSLRDYRGRALLVNFWATWCGACRLEMPWLAQLREQYAKQGFEVLGILTDRAPVGKVAAIEQKYGVRYPILMCNHKTAQAYGGLPYLPVSFFIDRQGMVIAEMTDAAARAQLEKNIRKTLAGSR